MKRLLLTSLLAGCAAQPMFIGPPTSLPSKDVAFTLAGSWAKPTESPAIGAPQVEGAMHLPVAEGFDVAVRAWSLGGGIQGRFRLLGQPLGAPVDLMIAPLVGVSTIADYRSEAEDAPLLPPIRPEFILGTPVVVGVVAGPCNIYAGADPAAHLRPDLFVLRIAALIGGACKVEGLLVTPELSYGFSPIGGTDLVPDGGYEEGERRHPLLASTLRFGVAVSF